MLAEVENGALINTFPKILSGLFALLVKPMVPLNRISLTSPDNEEGFIVTPDFMVQIFTTLKLPPLPPPAAAYVLVPLAYSAERIKFPKVPQLRSGKTDAVPRTFSSNILPGSNLVVKAGNRSEEHTSEL